MFFLSHYALALIIYQLSLATVAKRQSINCPDSLSPQHVDFVYIKII